MEIASVRTEVNSRNRDLAIAGRDGTVDVGDDSRERPRAARSAGLRNDAVAAAFLASGLHAQRQRRAASHTRRAMPGRTVRRRRRRYPTDPRRESPCRHCESRASRSAGRAARPDGAWRNTRSPRRARPGCGGRCAGSSAVRPDRRWRSPSRYSRSRRRPDRQAHRWHLVRAGACSMARESAWLTRQPKVTTAYFMGSDPGDGLRGEVGPGARHDSRG